MKRAKRPARESAPARRFRLAGLKQECRELRASLLAESLASETECASYWPGGVDNHYAGMDGWIYCFQQYGRLLGRLELREAQAREADRGDALKRAVAIASSRQPLPVTLSIGTKHVHQKSAWALFFLDSLDAIARPLTTLNLLLVEDASDELRGHAPLLHGEAWRTWAWILLHPDVGLPFDDVSSIELPEWTAQLLHEDFAAIYAAHQGLHRDIPVTMGAAFPPEDGERSRLSLEGFLAGYGSEARIAPSEIIRRLGFPEALSAAIATAESHRVAKINADAKREAPNR